MCQLTVLLQEKYSGVFREHYQELVKEELMM